MSVMRVIVFHRFTKFEFRRTCHYDDTADFPTNFQLATLFHSLLRDQVQDRQTEIIEQN